VDKSELASSASGRSVGRHMTHWAIRQTVLMTHH